METDNKVAGIFFWEAIIASGVTFALYTGDIKKGIIFTFIFTFVYFAIIALTKPFFDNKNK